MADRPFEIEPFRTRDPDAAHAAVGGLVDGVTAANRNDKLKEREASEPILEKDPLWSVKLLRALTEQDRHYAAERERLREMEPDAFDFSDDRARRLEAIRIALGEGVTLLLRRTLPLEGADLVDLLGWMAGTRLFKHRAARGAMAKQLAKIAGKRPLGPGVLDATDDLIAVMLEDEHKDARELVEPFQTLLTGLRGSADETPAPAGEPDGSAPEIAASEPVPGPAGHPLAMRPLKRAAGLLADDHDDAAATPTGPDAFPLPDGHPLADWHERLSVALGGYADADELFHEGFSARWEQSQEVRDKALAARDAQRDAALDPLYEDYDTDDDPLFVAICERLSQTLVGGGEATARRQYAWYALEKLLASRNNATSVSADRRLDFDRFLYAAAAGPGNAWAPEDETILARIEGHAAAEPLSDGERFVLHWMRTRSLAAPPLGVVPGAAARLGRPLDGGATLLLVPEDRWVVRLHRELAERPAAERAAWTALLQHAATASAAKPSAAWRKQAAGFRAAVGDDAFRGLASGWLGEVTRGRAVPETTEGRVHPAGSAMTIQDGNADTLRGLVWSLAAAPDERTPRTLGSLLATCTRKAPGVGPRALKVSNACVWALGQIAATAEGAAAEGAVGRMARLSAEVSHKPTKKALAKAMEKAAAAAGVSPADLEELGVPELGFAAGVRAEAFGEARVELRCEGNSIVTAWTNAADKPTKQPPAPVKQDHRDELKELKAVAKEAAAVIVTGRKRLDAMHLADASWALADWRERWLDHGLLGTLARRLVWTVDGVAATFLGGDAVGLDGEPVAHGATAEVRLWHPLDADGDGGEAWRGRLSSLGVEQPIEQVDRAVFAAAGAKRKATTEDDRLVGRRVRQHAFAAAAREAGWEKSLQLAVDMEDEPAARPIPALGLRAELDVSTASGPTNDSGVYDEVALGSLRIFSLTEASGSPIPLRSVPPRVLSEVLRDAVRLADASAAEGP